MKEKKKKLIYDNEADRSLQPLARPSNNCNAGQKLGVELRNKTKQELVKMSCLTGCMLLRTDRHTMLVRYRLVWSTTVGRDGYKWDNDGTVKRVPFPLFISFVLLTAFSSRSIKLSL